MNEAFGRCSGVPDGTTKGLSSDRRGRFELRIDSSGDRSQVREQFVSYPFHMTRPFRLDREIPTLLTVYQQSSSGGLYRGDALYSRIDVGAGAAAHVTTQAATIVHDCQGRAATSRLDATVGDAAFLALTPDPLVLFPGAWSETVLTARLAPGAVLLATDAFGRFDPAGQDRPFASIGSTVRIEDWSGRLLVRDAFQITGADHAAECSPSGSWPYYASFILAGDAARLPTVAALERVVASSDAIAGVGRLPNRAGWSVRCLAATALAVRRIADAVFGVAVETALGAAPAPRRK